MIDKRNKIENEERAILVGLVHKDQTEQQLQEYLDELAFLAETADRQIDQIGIDRLEARFIQTVARQ